MIQTFYPLPLIAGVSALTVSPVTVTSTSAAAAASQAVIWITTYS